jgi:acyl-CoA synthetase (AMP-forming)/AMP-acid ligase II
VSAPGHLLRRGPFPGLRVRLAGNPPPQISLINLYGPTEAAIACTYGRFGEYLPFDPGKSVLIGKPCRDVEILILDSELDEEADVGEIGRLTICGSQIGPGYWRRPELTSTMFRINPLKADLGARMYGSGDLAYKDAHDFLRSSAVTEVRDSSRLPPAFLDWGLKTRRGNAVIGISGIVSSLRGIGGCPDCRQFPASASRIAGRSLEEARLYPP